MASEILNLSNFDSVNETARSTTATPSASAQAVVALQNASGFVDESFVVIDPMSESAELGQIDSISGSNLTLKSSLARSHVAGAKVVQLAGNQIKLYRASNVDGSIPSDDSFSAYASTNPANPITIQPDQSYTQVIDENGGNGFWYKAVFYNSATDEATDISFAVAVRGGDYGRYATLEDIREEAGFTKFDNVTDSQVELARSKAESEINGVLGSVGYTLPMSVEVPLLTTLTQLLASGHLLVRSYGSGAEGTNKDGQSLKNDAREMLKRISEGKVQLVDSSGNIVANSSNSIGSELTSIEGATRDPSFRMDHVF